MKKLNLLIVAFVALLTFSCSKDDGPAPITIESTLTTSKQAYQNANDGEWVAITELEYKKLVSDLDNISKVGNSDEMYTSDDTPSSTGGNPYTFVNDNGATIPKNSYLFAVKFYSTNENASGTKVKVSSTSITEGYNDLGNVLPNHGKGHLHFVLKGSNNPTTNTGYMAMYENGSVIGLGNNDSSKYYEKSGDVLNFTNTNVKTKMYYMFQGLSATKKQW